MGGDRVPAERVRRSRPRRRSPRGARAGTCRARSGGRPARRPRAAPCTAASSAAAPPGRRRAPCAGRRTCTASRRARRSPSRRRRSARAGRSGRRRPTRARPPRARARRPGATSGAVPTEFAAAGKATTFVRGGALGGRGRRGRARGRRATSTKRTTMPMSSASASHGATFASWSSRVHEHLVAGLELAGERAREQEVERGHALPERDLAGIAAEERGGALVRGVDQLVRPARRLVGRADVRVVLAQVAGDRVDHLVGALRPARARRRTRAGGRARVKRARTAPTSSSVALTRPSRYVQRAGFAVSDAPTKQSRSAFASSSAAVSSSGLGSKETSTLDRDEDECEPPVRPRAASRSPARRRSP